MSGFTFGKAEFLENRTKDSFDKNRCVKPIYASFAPGHQDTLAQAHIHHGVSTSQRYL